MSTSHAEPAPVAGLVSKGPVVLIVIDGWGVAPPSQGNAIGRAKMRAWSRMTKDYLYGELIASGESVGLQANEVGSSGVGHLTIGAGRVVTLSVTKINQDIDDGSFMDNPTLHVIKNRLHQNESKLHLMGLVGVGTVHSSMKHLWAILDFCAENEIKEVYLHLFTDGRDSPPTSGKQLIGEIEEKLAKLGVGRIATLGGRYYGMDRDRRNERTARAYEAIVNGIGHRARSAGEAIEYWYSKKVTDEFVEPTVIVRSAKENTGSTSSESRTSSTSTEGMGSMDQISDSKYHKSYTKDDMALGKEEGDSKRTEKTIAEVKSKIAEVKEQIAETKGQISYIRNHISDIATPLRQNAGLAALSRKLEILDHSEPIATVEPGDVVFFFNFRADRARQLTQMFCDQKPYRVMSNEQEVMSNEQETRVTEGKENKTKENRDKETAGGPNGADGLFVSMTNYHEDLRVDLSAYETQPVESPVSEVVSRANLKQLYLAESEKERFVTYYFNGLRQDRFPLEDVVIVPSPKVPTYDKKPEMALPEITQAFLKGLRSGDYRFLMMNFANPDMVAHSGNLRATIKACQYVDQALKTVSEAVLRMQGTLVVTADHGNAEELLTLPRHAFFFTTSQGAVNTDHSNNPVPIVIVGEKFKGKGSLAKGGALADVAPTVLGLLGLLQPPVMTGRNLLSTIDRRT